MKGAWRVRIDEVQGDVRRTLGAGSLISENLVLTCAHVVHKSKEIRVAFPQAERKGLLDVPAAVYMLGPWKSPGDEGDVAVLKLEMEVDVPPARLLCRLEKMEGYAAHGFPRAHGIYGTGIGLDLTSKLPHGEWHILHTAILHGESPSRGFSGAAVYDNATGDVIGIITDYEIDLKKRTCRMLSIDRIRRYWEELDDLLYLPWLSQKERRELRKIVSSALSNTDLSQLVSQVFPSTSGHRDLCTVWDAIRYVGEEMHGEDRLARFLPMLAKTFTTEDAQRSLRKWIRDHLGADAVHVAEPKTAVVVRLDAVREGYDLEVSALIDNEPISQPWRTTVPSKDQVRAQVEVGFKAIKHQVAGTSPQIEFVLPLSLLNEPVEEWEYGRDIPVITKRAVLRYVDRLTDIDEWDSWTARTKRLSDRNPEDPQLVGCEDTDPRRLYIRLTKASDACVLVSTSRLEDAMLAKILRAGLPVIIWPRDPCREDEHHMCQAVRNSSYLVDKIAVTAPVDIPELVRIMRLDAYEEPDKPHIGRNLALLWDDPERSPDPPTYMPE